MSGYYPNGTNQADFDRAFDELGPEDDADLALFEQLEQEPRSIDELTQANLQRRLDAGQETTRGRISICGCGRKLRVGTAHCYLCERERLNELYGGWTCQQPKMT